MPAPHISFGAPPAGTDLCAAGEIGLNESRVFTFGSGRRRFVMFVHRLETGFVAFENSCPHAHLPLDWQEGKFLSPDNKHFQCANHGARFTLTDGVCVAGPCMGEALRKVPLRLSRERLVIAS